MKYSIILLFLLTLASCHPGRQLYKTYKIEDSKGFISDISSEIIEFQSQGTVQGQIVDQLCHEKIIGVTIILYNKKVVLGTISDANGRFQISNIPDDSYHFVVSLIGYHSFVDSISISINELKTLTVELIESPIEIGGNK